MASSMEYNRKIKCFIEHQIPIASSVNLQNSIDFIQKYANCSFELLLMHG